MSQRNTKHCPIIHPELGELSFPGIPHLFIGGMGEDVQGEPGRLEITESGEVLLNGSPVPGLVHAAVISEPVKGNVAFVSLHVVVIKDASVETVIRQAYGPEQINSPDPDLMRYLKETRGSRIITGGSSAPEDA